MTVDFPSLLEKTKIITNEAAAFIRSQAGKVRQEEIITKSPNSLVSYVDKTAEEMLVSGLSGLIPGAGFITEEDTVDQETSEYTWIIDPLDGTTNFLQSIPVYSVSVGLVYGGQVVLGVICDVAQQETFYAHTGGGAWCNGQRIRVSDRKAIGDAVVATGFPYAAHDRLSQLTVAFHYFLEHARGIRRLGSAAIDLAYVACGRFDLYYETTLNAWDIAAGILLVREAGGVVTDFSGGQDMLDNGQVLAATPQLHATVAGQISALFGA